MPLDPKNDMTNKLLTGAIIGLLSWNLFTTHRLSIDVAVLVTKVENIKAEISRASK